MSLPLATRTFALALGGVLSLATTRAAAADDKRSCLDAHAQGQELRLAGKFREAAKRFRVCASGCPQPITLDCTRWEQELRAATPSVVIAAERPDGTDTVDARLIVDGAHLAERLPSTAVELDPGEHTIRLEAAGYEPVEQRFVVREREQDRRVTFRFVSAGGLREARQRADSGPPMLGIVLVGAGAVAAGVGVTFGLLGKTREDELADQCGKDGTCPTEEVDVVRQRYLIAGIAGGVGAVCLALGIWQLVSRNNRATSTAALSWDGVRFRF